MYGLADSTTARVYVTTGTTGKFLISRNPPDVTDIKYPPSVLGLSNTPSSIEGSQSTPVSLEKTFRNLNPLEKQITSLPPKELAG